MPYVRPPAEPKPAHKAYPSDLTDAEWLLLEPLLPVTTPRGQPRIHSYRALLDGILYVLRNGCTWAALPHALPPPGTVYAYFRDWQLDGTWKRLHDALMAADRELAGRAPEPTAGALDSQTAKTTERGALGATTGPRSSSGASGTSWSTPTGG